MTPSVLLSYQQRWLADKSPVRIAEKSRRIGWSWASAAEVTLNAAKQAGTDAWYVGYNKDMAQEYIRDCAFWARHFNLFASSVQESIFEDDDPDKKILTYSITFASGFRVTALSSRPTNLRGKRGHIVIDEAAFHEDLKGLVKAAMAVLMWGGTARVDIISTHNGNDSYFNLLCEEVRAGKRPYSLHRMTLDDALTEGLYARICLVNGVVWTKENEVEWRKALFAQYGDDAQEELLCVPSRSGGTYITRDLVERQMRPGAVLRLTLEDGFVLWKEELRVTHIEQWLAEHVLPELLKLPKDLMHFFGEDFGRVSDRTVIIPGYLTQDLVRKFPFAVELSNVPYEQQKQVVFYIVDRLPRFIGGALDATGNGAYLAEVAMQKFGTKVQRIDLSEKWYNENLPKLKDAFEHETIEVVRDADHMLDLSSFKVVNGLPKLPKAKTATVSGEGPPRHGDAAIAYLLGHFASRQPIAEYGYQAAPKVVKTPQVTRPSRMQGFKNSRGGLL
jgi:phage FluMu gp28-like protein